MSRHTSTPKFDSEIDRPPKKPAECSGKSSFLWNHVGGRAAADIPMKSKSLTNKKNSHLVAQSSPGSAWHAATWPRDRRYSPTAGNKWLREKLWKSIATTFSTVHSAKSVINHTNIQSLSLAFFFSFSLSILADRSEPTGVELWIQWNLRPWRSANTCSEEFIVGGEVLRTND